jgi:hypothetical protein
MMGRGTFETMRDYKDEIAERYRMLEPLEAGDRAMEPRGGVLVDVTDGRIQWLKRDIAIYEHCIARLERQMSGA